MQTGNPVCKQELPVCKQGSLFHLPPLPTVTRATSSCPRATRPHHRQQCVQSINRCTASKQPCQSNLLVHDSTGNVWSTRQFTAMGLTMSPKHALAPDVPQTASGPIFQSPKSILHDALDSGHHALRNPHGSDVLALHIARNRVGLQCRQRHAGGHLHDLLPNGCRCNNSS